MPPRRQNTRTPGKLQESLVLFKYLLSLFGTKDLASYSRDLKETKGPITEENTLDREQEERV